MVHPSQAEALCWRLHGMGGDSSSAYNPAYDTCAAGFTHSTCDDMLRVNHTSSVPLIPCVQFTLGVSPMLFVTHFIRVPCMLRVPLLLHVPLMMIATQFTRVSCILYVLCMLHMPLILHVSHMLLVPCTFCLPCMVCVCALHTFFQLFQMIWHFKSDFSLVLVMSLFPYTLYCAFMLLHTNMSNCFQNNAFTGEK